ncbi:hypothetical protein [Algoriphagus sp.]|uniref:hypothetical protein n=1 Tax=Algoriphagus sp. TaxID=1872435 RepID=UPI002631CAC4|nr:hypothetical protein [Algoriphagus sp.]
MVDKKSNIPQWSDPKDYGLPYVEVRRLAELSKETTPQKETHRSQSEEKEDLSAAALRAKTAQVIKPKPVQESFEDEGISEEKQLAEKQTPRIQPGKKKSNWVIYVVMIGLLLVSTVVWQLMKEENVDSQAIENNLVENAQVDEPSSKEKEVNSSLNQKEEGAVNQDSSMQVSPPLIESEAIEESGTTIEQPKVDSLIRVERKATRPQYFIVVGSLPNERLALQESNQYYDRVDELFLILPYEDVPNYRLAIGRFNSFTQANNQLEQIKDQYTEALWILKY